MGGGEDMYSFKLRKNPHFDDEYDIHVSSKIHEEDTYDLDFDLLIISYYLMLYYSSV